MILQLGFRVAEVVAADYSVTTTITKANFTLEDSGPFTVVTTNANSGTSVTFTIEAIPTVAPNPEDIVISGNGISKVENGHNIHKEDQDVLANIMFLGQSASHNEESRHNVPKQNHNQEDVIDKNTSENRERKPADGADVARVLATTPEYTKSHDHVQAQQRKRNAIGVFAAMFIMAMCVLVVFVIVRKRKRDVAYRRIPTSTVLLKVRAENYGTYNLCN